MYSHARTTARTAASVALLLFMAGCSHDITQPAAHNAPPPAVSATIATTLSPGVSDGQGTAWRQLTETVGLTWTQVASLCPRDGISPCQGRIGNTDLSGWVWATEAQTLQLLARYAPAITTSPVLSGVTHTASVNAFFVDFTPTDVGGCAGTGYLVTCSFGAHASGWTATSPAPGSAISASVQSGFSIDPRLQIGPDTHVLQPSSVRGLFMWRADGSGGTGIVANDDSATVDSPYHGVVVSNVLANDLLAGEAATIGTTTITSLSSTNPALVLDPSTGTVSLTAGARVGVEVLTYRICETARPSNCSSARVTVTIRGNRVDAVDDAGSGKTGYGTAVANVLANDTFAEGSASLANVTLATVTPDAGLTLESSGAVTIVSGASPGTHRLTYEICEVGNPTNCDQATVTVTVTPYAIDAVQDEGSAPSSLGGTAIATVLANDTFDGRAATTATVSISLVTSASPSLTLDPVSGAVRVAAGAPAGLHTLTYQICETNSPSNCDRAAARVTVRPQGYDISKDRIRLNEGSSGSFTVKLQQQPAGPVTVAVSYLAGTMTVTPGVSSLNFTAANWNVAQTVTFRTTKDSGRDDNAGTLQLTAVDVPTRHVVISGIDTDRKSTDPVSIWQAPYNGQTVSGAVEVWGTATSSVSTIADAKFSVNSTRISTVTSTTGTFRAGFWNSATVPNGWHTLEMRSTDRLGRDSRAFIRVFVNN